ncbi:MAG: CAP domain-containing protein [Leptospiraceae bacterium]|nr:CAP domain-containing protein [Leptospiraceae bacterium]MCK6379626.1 CAP domain-containing protein [Leptospiraceae bacterium]
MLKNLIVVFFLLFIISFGLNSEDSILTPLEKEVLDEINLLRQNPPKYSEILVEYKKYFDGKLIRVPGKIAIRTNEGISAVDEAIRELKKAESLETLQYSKGLSLASKSHVNDTGPKGSVGHTGTDGSTPSSRMNRFGKWDLLSAENISYGYNVARDVLIQLIVDDGVPSRGHRLNLLKKGIHYAGVGCGDHKMYKSMCVMNFAGKYTEKDTGSNESVNNETSTKEPATKNPTSIRNKVLPKKSDEW